MQIVNLFGKTMVSMAVLLMFGDVRAAETSRAGRTMTPANNSRMVTIGSGTMNSMGNTTVSTTSTPKDVTIVSSSSSSNTTITPVTTPITNPGSGSVGSAPAPKPEPKPKPAPECEDGGVKNSKYTIDMCMSDVKQCINTGALQGGLNDLFNEEVRNAIFTGMKLCQTNIDKCINDVRVNCRNIYNESSDVWLDFNSRVIQPEYYNFVLRKTGLSPHQAENTCLLLDRNTYGASFASVSDMDTVRAEYQKKVGAYNGADGKNLSKEKPQGVEVNTIGYDGKRGHYARWDAASGQCLVRVGAYNKNSAIKNSWLFGAVGNDNVAEVWQPTGSTFTCNKDLFGFSLLNDTKTAAVVGIAGGAVVGAAAGAGVYNAQQKKAEAATANPCKDAEHRRKLGARIRVTGNKYLVEKYSCESASLEKQDNKQVFKCSSYLLSKDTDYDNLSEDECNAFYDLYAKAKMYDVAIKTCEADYKDLMAGVCGISGLGTDVIVNSLTTTDENEFGLNGDTGNGRSVGCPVAKFTSDVVSGANEVCLFKPLLMGFAENSNDSPLCGGHGCRTTCQIKNELKSLWKVLKEIEPDMDKGVVSGTSKPKSSKGAMIGKGAAIGAAAGVGAGGLATAITAFVERSNISCKVGDGLESVSLGKTHTIDTLKNFYVKWSLQLPDTLTPTAAVTDIESWQQACSQFNHKLYDCPNVQINYKKNGKYELIPSACRLSGTICIVNDAVAISRGEEEEAVEAVTHKERPHKQHGKPDHKPDGKKLSAEDVYDYDGWYPGGVYAEHAYDGSVAATNPKLFPIKFPAIDTERVQKSMEAANSMSGKMATISVNDGSGSGDGLEL